MKLSGIFSGLCAVVATTCCCLLPAPLFAQPEGTVMPPGIRWGSERTPEPGVQMRSYVFEETGETLPYSVYVSSKIEPGDKAPLIVALRGFTGNTLTIVRGTALDLAEENGYILVGALGYNNRAGFGVPPRAPRPAANNASPQQQPPLVGGTVETDPAKVTAYSEKDVMNVLAMVRDEFNIDDSRIYLMGHSQGGGGARHIAEKYPEIWAGVALLAPAIFDVELSSESNIAHIPTLIAVGDKDTLAEGNREFSERLAAFNPDVEFKLYEGLDHGTIILGSMPEVYAFFGRHSKAP
ncbi:MAG: alpha/beta hydrolase [Pseudomonadota bacterium]|nr:alpha/beta hydrolase [Pseudomonadota bacterium]